MTFADRQAAALAALASRTPPGRRFPGETQPSGDMPVDWRDAVAYLDARDEAEKETHQ
ncbi:hypothetical protein [Streptomyces sp. WAC 04229]|uniref:hypothetical protein n=1 Tax=Streptomyces sp. WAC 04229 TaxID=2203206 RepID=UPI00163C25F5|nr:hypothetical protein [Streptomyces sp. WAC 04229]